MTSFRQLLVLGVALATAGMAVGWAGDTVNTWVDSEGVRHFSQFPPPENVQQLETIQLDTPPAAVPLDERLDSIRAVSRDLELARQQREEERRERSEKTVVPERSSQQPADESYSGSHFLPYPYMAPYPPRYPYPPPQSHRHGRRPPPQTDKPAPLDRVPHSGVLSHDQTMPNRH